MEKLICNRGKMRTYQKLIIPVLSLALTYLPGCSGSNDDSQSSGSSRKAKGRYLELTGLYQGKKPAQPSIIYFTSNPPNTPLELKVNGEEIPLGIPSGDFGDGLGTYNNLESLDAKGRPTGKRIFSLTALRPCTLRVECSQIPEGDSFAETFPYSGNPVVSTSEIKQMAKDALSSGRASQDTSSYGGEGNGRGGWFNGLFNKGGGSLQDWLNDVSKRDQRRARQDSTSANPGSSLKQYLGEVSKRDTRRATK